MAKLNLNDYDIIASKPLSMDEYEVIEEPVKNTGGASGSWEKPTLLQKAGQTLGDIGKGLGLAIPAGMGETIASGAKLAELGSELTGGDKWLRPWWSKYIPEAIMKPVKGLIGAGSNVIKKFTPEEWEEIPTSEVIGEGISDTAYKMIAPLEAEAGKLSAPGQFAYQAGKPVANIVLSGLTGQALATGLKSAVSKGIIEMTPFALSAAGNYAKEAELEGANPLQQAAYGTVMGIMEGATEKIPMDEWFKIAGGKKGILTWIKSMGVEGLQELLMDPVANLNKKFMQITPDMPWTGEGGVLDPKQMSQSFAGGIGTGALMAGGSTVTNRILKRMTQAPKTKTQEIETAQQEAPVAEEVTTPETEVPVERRINLRLREKLEGMNPEELYQNLYQHEKTGMLNARAYEEVLNNPNLRKPIQVEVDVDGLKWFNDNLGHETGDALLKNMADALKSLGHEDVFHKQGDEFFAQFDTEEEAIKAMEKVDNFLRRATIRVELPDGTIKEYEGGGFSYGIGTTPAEADAELRIHKEQRTAAGYRSARGEKPPGLRERTVRVGDSPQGVEGVADSQAGITESKPEINGPSQNEAVFDYSTLTNDQLKQRQEELIAEEVQRIRQEYGKGVSLVPGQDGSDRKIRMSNNPKWYRDFFAAHKRAPNKSELRQMAIERLSKGFTDETAGPIPPNPDYLVIGKRLSQAQNQLAPKEKQYPSQKQKASKVQPGDVFTLEKFGKVTVLKADESLVTVRNSKGNEFQIGINALNRLRQDETAEPLRKGGSSKTSDADIGGYAYREQDQDTQPDQEVARNLNTVTRTVKVAPAAQSVPYAERSRSAIQLPEIVEIAKELNEGKHPVIKEKLRNALGLFRHIDAPIGIGDIFLRDDIFLGPAIETKRAKNPRKLKALFEAIQAKHAGDPNIVVRKKGLVVTAYRKDPTLAPKVLAHEIGHLADWLPDKTSKRGNILGHLASLQGYLKHSIQLPNLTKRKEIMDELKAVSMEWKPFDPEKDPEYTKYRYKPNELYADAISVLFNEPELLKSKAPKFYKAFFSYLNNKPEVKRVYDEIQDRLTNPETVGEHRLTGVYEMLEEGNKTREQAVKRGIPKIKGIIDSFEKLFIDRDAPLLKQIRAGKKQGGDVAELAKKAQYELEETKYLASEANDYISTLNKTVMEPLAEAGLKVEDMGAYMLAKRAATERATIANPRGLDEAAANRMIADLKTKLGATKFKALEDMVATYRKLREDWVIPQVDNSGMYSKELIDLMKSSKHYARFNVLHYLEQKFGGQGTARVYRQIGTLGDIENPFIATVVQDISMIRAAKINRAKSTVARFMNSIGQAEPADMVYSQDVKGMVPKDPKDPDMRVFSVLRDGKMQSYYVHKDIAESFEKNPIEAHALAQVFSRMSEPIKNVMVSKNPIWMARNIIRDVRATIKNVPEIRIQDVPKLAKYYTKAFRDVWQDVMKGERSQDIAAMMKGYMLNPNRQYSGRDFHYENEIERLVNEFQVNPGAAIKAEGLKGRLKRFWETLDRLGRVSELTGKVAGYKYLKAESSLSDQEIGHRVRTLVGTPDARRQGALHQFTNNIFMFSNINKEGIRSSIEAFNENRGRYIWKTMWMNVLPKLILVGAAAAGSDELKRLLAKIPEYDKLMYDIVPIGINKAGKAVYLRIPQDYEGQLWGALTWALSKGKFVGARGALDTIGEQSPYNLNPIIKTAGDLYMFYIKGQNPTDDYRGRPVIPEKVFTAGGWDAQKAMGKHVWQSLGGSAIYTPGDYSERNAGFIEKILKYPGLNILGAFLKVSDRGDLEEYYAEEEAKRKEQSQRSLKVENRVIEAVKSTKGIPTVSDIMKTYQQAKKDELIPKSESFAEFKNRYYRYASKVLPDNDLRILLKDSKAERIERLKELRKTRKPAEYAKIINNLNRMGVSYTATSGSSLGF